MSEHTFFLAFYDYEWDAISAIATTFAAAIALALPFLIKWLDARAEKRRLIARYHEVVTATYDAFKCLNGAIEDFNRGRATGQIELGRAAARASARAGTLRILATMPGLSDGAIASCIGSAETMDQIVEAQKIVRLGHAQGVTGHLEAALTLAQETEVRIDNVVRHLRLAMPQSIKPPKLPNGVL